MGVEYPYLAILAVVAFTVAVTGVVYFFVHTYTEMLKTPVLSTYAEACYSESTAYLTVTLKHERGLPVVLERVEVYSERGLITLTPSLSPPGIQVVLEGFNGRLGPGQVGVVRVVLPLEYFKLDREYSGVVFFDAGNTVFTFQLVECSAPGVKTITTTLRARLVDLNKVAGSGTVTAAGRLRVVAIERSLESRRNILYYDAFDTNPFETGRVVSMTCSGSWRWDPVEKAILFDGKTRSTTYGGECILEFQNSASPLNGTIYVSTIVKFIDGEGWAEIVLVQSESALYTLGIFMDKEAGGNTSRGYDIWRFKERWGPKPLARQPDSSLNHNVTYHIVASYTYGEGLLALYVNSTDPKVTVVDKSVIPLRVGLIGTYPSEAHVRRPAARPLKVYFYNLVITVDAPPWFTNITSVPAGWRVDLKDSTGSVVASGVSTSGTVALSMWNYLVVPNGTIKVYDENGNLVAARTFDYVIGGEVYELRVYEFNALMVGIGSSSRILVYNISNIENPVLVTTVDTSTLFNGSADIALASGNLYLLNTSGVFRYYFYNLTLGVWRSVTSACRATGIGARIEAVRDTLVVIPGSGNSSLCLYNLITGEVKTVLLAAASITEYTSTAVYGELLYVSLVNTTTGLPVIVIFRVSGTTATLIGYYSITGYRLTGLAHDGQSRLLFIHEYGGVYELDTTTGSLRLLPILLPFTPRGFGDRVEYYSRHLIFVRGDETTELYLVPLST